MVGMRSSQDDVCIRRVHAGCRRTTAVLIIEVADTTLSFDRDVKLPSYARYGVQQTWLVHMEALMVTTSRLQP